MTSKYFPPCDVTRVARGANWNKALIPVRRYPHMQRKISCTVIKLCVLPLPTIKLRHWQRPPTDGANLLTLRKKRENILVAFINECLPCSKWNLHNLHGWNLQKNVVGKKKKNPMPLLVAVRGEKRKSKSLKSRQLCEERWRWHGVGGALMVELIAETFESLKKKKTPTHAHTMRNQFKIYEGAGKTPQTLQLD